MKEYTKQRSEESIANVWENMSAGISEASPEPLQKAVNVTGEIESKVRDLDHVKPVLDELSRKKNGVPVSMVFNKHVIRSDMSEDEIFLEVLGRVKNPDDLLARELAEQRRNEMLTKAEAETPKRIMAGNVLAYTEKQQEWKEFVNSGARDLYFGLNLDFTIKIMINLDNGVGFEKVDELISQAYLDDGVDPAFTLETIFSFSKKGPEFYEWKIKNTSLINKDDKVKIAKQKLENAKMELHDLENSENE